MSNTPDENDSNDVNQHIRKDTTYQQAFYSVTAIQQRSSRCHCCNSPGGLGPVRQIHSAQARQRSVQGVDDKDIYAKGCYVRQEPQYHLGVFAGQFEDAGDLCPEGKYHDQCGGAGGHQDGNSRRNVLLNGLDVAPAIFFSHQLHNSLAYAEVSELRKTQNGSKNKPDAIFLVTEEIQVNRVSDCQDASVDYCHCNAGKHIDAELAGKQSSNHKIPAGRSFSH